LTRRLGRAEPEAKWAQECNSTQTDTAQLLDEGRKGGRKVQNIIRLITINNDMIYLLTANGLPPGGSSTVHIYTQTLHRTTQLTNREECGPCPVFARYILTFALQLRKKHGKKPQSGYNNNNNNNNNIK
jgi:hypothetical protein